VTPRASLADSRDCQLKEATPNSVNSIGFPLAAERIPSTGSPKINVVYLDFPDAPARTRDFDPVTEFQKTYQRDSDEYLAAMSYETHSPQWSVHPNVVRFPRAVAEYQMVAPSRDPRLWYQLAGEAIAHVDAEVDFTNSAAAIFIAHPDVPRSLMNAMSALPRPPGWGYSSAEGAVFNSLVVTPPDPNYTVIRPWQILVHEYGHLMGLVDLYAYPGTGVDQGSPTGVFAMMGSGMPNAEVMGWNRWLLNWLHESEIRCVQNSGTTVHALFPISSRLRGEKLVVLPTSNTRAVVVEAKREDRYCVGCTSGVQVYTVDTTIENGRGPIQIAVKAGQQRPPTVKNAILTLGENVTVDGVSVTVTDSGPQGQLVTIVRP
jgi:M6 family metalloprotease-like protein